MKRLFVIAAIATLATAAQAEEAADNTAAASTTTTVTAPAATTVAATDVQSTTTLPTAAAAAAPAKSWSVTILNQTTADASDFNYRDNDKKTFKSDNFVGAGYKIDAKNRVGIRHNFQAVLDGKKDETTTTNRDPSIIYGRSGVAGILKSDELAPAFMYYVPATETSRNMNSYGKLRADLVIPWTLTPKWSIAYTLSPRQDVVPESQMLNSKGELKDVYSRTTLIHNPNLTYTINDKMDVYSGLTFIHVLSSRTAKIEQEEIDLGVGMNFSLLGGKVSLNPEVTLAKVTVEDGNYRPEEDTLQEKNFSYTLTSVIAF